MTLANAHGAGSVAEGGDWYSSSSGAAPVLQHSAQRALLVELLAHTERMADLAGTKRGYARMLREAKARDDRLDLKKIIHHESLAAAAAIRKALEESA